jgi:hypothetical protein
VNPCIDIVVWTVGMSVGLVMSLVSLVFAVSDRRALWKHLKTREEDTTRRPLGPRMIHRMKRNANHAVFTETVRVISLGLLLYVGVATLLNMARVCAFNPLTWILITAGLLIVLNSLHAIYTRIGNSFVEGDTDQSDAARDVTRDAAREVSRDEDRDAARDMPRDVGRDAARDVPRDVTRDAAFESADDRKNEKEREIR